MKPIIVTGLLVLITYANIFAQKNLSFHSCITPHQFSPNLLKDSKTADWDSQYAKWQSEEDTATLYINMVFNVVWHSDEERIPEAQIHQQVADLNEAFNSVNVSAIREVFRPSVAVPKIKFQLAQIDPNGNPTTGIRYVYTEKDKFVPQDLDLEDIIEIIIGGGSYDDLIRLLNPFIGIDDVKKTEEGGIAPWDTLKYMNVWVCDAVMEGMFWELLGLKGDVLGYARPPKEAPFFAVEDTSGAFTDLIDGVVINYKVCGKNNSATPPEFVGKVDQGKIMVHEVGHYLGLAHIWGIDGCESDDLIGDTPNASIASTFDCGLDKNSCVESSNDFPDMVENYMDYSSDDCKQMFTVEQVALMRTMLKTHRSSLLEDQTVVNIEEETGNYFRPIVYPNPSRGMAWVKMPNNESVGNATIEVYNFIGQVVWKMSIENSFEAVFDWSGLKKGTYLVKISKEDKAYTQRVLLY